MENCVITCLKCGDKKEPSAFPKDHTRKSGLHPYCLICKRDDSRARSHRKRQEMLERGQLYCLKCGQEKPAMHFYVANSRRRSLLCEDCKKDNKEKEAVRSNERNYRRYWSNPEHYRKQRSLIDRTRRETTKIELIVALGGRCRDCGLELSEEWPVACFDFHHLCDKKFAIARLVKCKDRTRLLGELRKCELLCSNCHRRRHYRSLKENQSKHACHDPAMIASAESSICAHSD